MPHLPIMHKTTHARLVGDSPSSAPITPHTQAQQAPQLSVLTSCPPHASPILDLRLWLYCDNRCTFSRRLRRRRRSLGLTTGPSGRQVGLIFIAVYRKLIQEQMDEREAFQRMRRVQLGRDTPTYANLGRYYEPFEESVAPISATALEYAFPPIHPNTPAPSASFEAEVPMGRTTPSSQLLYIEGYISPVQTSAHPSQIYWPTLISPASSLNFPVIAAPPSGIQTVTPTEADVIQIDLPYVEDLNPIDGTKEETGGYIEDTDDESRYADSTDEDEDEEYPAPGPSNRRGKKSIRRMREEAAAYSLEENAPKRWYKPRVVADQDDFPHPPIPNPGHAREQAEYSAGKLKWWSQRVLRPLLSASPKPLSKDAILSMIKKDLGLEGDAWSAFHDEHLVRRSLL
jgi:hypothetical protein